MRGRLDLDVLRFGDHGGLRWMMGLCAIAVGRAAPGVGGLEMLESGVAAENLPTPKRISAGATPASSPAVLFVVVASSSRCLPAHTRLRHRPDLRIVLLLARFRCTVLCIATSPPRQLQTWPPWPRLRARTRRRSRKHGTKPMQLSSIPSRYP